MTLPASVRDVARDLARQHNVLVLVPDWDTADLWIDHAEWLVGDDPSTQRAVEDLSSGHVGLVVSVGDYRPLEQTPRAFEVLLIDGPPRDGAD